MPRMEEYVMYVDKHISRVKEMWLKMKVHPEFPYRSDECFLSLMDVLIENHDASKYSHEELEPYARHFYPETGDVEMDGEFEDAVNHHYRMNPHHWQFWLKPEGVMVANPFLRHLYLCEMVCDWMAVGVDFGNTATAYYKKMEGKIILDPHSETFVKMLLMAMEPEEWKEN